MVMFVVELVWLGLFSVCGVNRWILILMVVLVLIVVFGVLFVVVIVLFVVLGFGLMFDMFGEIDGK